MKFNAEKVVYNESNIFSRPCSIAFMGSWKNKKGKQMILFFIETAVCSKEVFIPLDKLNTPAELNSILLNMSSISVIAKGKDWKVFSAWAWDRSYDFLVKYPMFSSTIRWYRLLEDLDNERPKNSLVLASPSSSAIFHDDYSAIGSIKFSEIGNLYEPLTDKEVNDQRR